MTEKKRRLDFGYITGMSSIFLGTLALVGILCFKFPEILTTPELREVYTAEMVENLMFGAILAAFLFALASFLLSTRRKNAAIGALITSVAVALGGFNVEGRSVEKVSWSIGLDWLLLDLFLMALIFVPIELAFPKRKEQSRFHEEWRTDLVYFAISHLAIQLIGVVTKKPAESFFGWMNLGGVHQWVQDMPFILELFLAIFLTDLFQYWTHRIFHNSHYLWRFHAVHHSIRHMDWLAGSRLHFMDIFVTRSMSYIPLYVMGFSTLTFNIAIVFIALHTVLIHSNTNINFGILKYALTTPQYHHWHHCEEPEHYGKNFAAIFPFIDKIFGTYYLPGKEWPKATGLHDASFPKGFVKQLVYPFAKDPFKDNLEDEKKSRR